MEQNIKRSETIVKKNRDDWVDEKGYLHNKFTKEIITGPIDNVQASQIEEPLLQRIIRPLMNRSRLMMRGIPLQSVPQVQQKNVQPDLKLQVQQVQPVQPQQKPQMDFVALMEAGKKVLDDMGIDPKELFSDVLGNKPTEDKIEPLEDKVKPLTDEKGVNKEWKKQKPLKNLKKKKQKKINQKIKQKKVQNKSE